MFPQWSAYPCARGYFSEQKVSLLSLALSISHCSHSVFKTVVLNRFTIASNALRRSRRLRGQAPEEDKLGVCFICQDEFNMEQLSRLQQTACCGVLMHCRCHEEMVARTSICGNCIHDTFPGNTRALALDLENSLEEPHHLLWLGTNLIEEVSRKLNEYRQFGLPNPHRRDSRLWSLLPFDILDVILFEYLASLKLWFALKF